MKKKEVRGALDELSLKAPGLTLIARGGSEVPYWVAPKAARKAGFEPKTVHLHYEGTLLEIAREIASRCAKLQGDMLEWQAGAPPDRSAYAPGTLGWLGNNFQTDADSPYRDRRQDTQKFYDDSISIIQRTVGTAAIAEVTGRDVRRWYKSWGRPDEAGILKNPRRAYACIQTLRRIVGYGCESRDKACLELMAILSEMRFAVPIARSQHMTAEQAGAFRKAAHDLGRHSMALAVTLQRSLALRQRDVIGEWVQGMPSGIMDRGRGWHAGLLWGENIRADMTLIKRTSKSNFTREVEHDLTLHADVMEEIGAVPVARRIGPVIIQEITGRPYKIFDFSHRFREIARKAGIPDDVRNMDAKAGALTDGYDAGADPADLMKMGDHTNMKTNQRYNRTSIEKTSRVARLVAARRGGGEPEQR